MLREALLALLQEGPRHGYDLRATFERMLGGTWPLNVGQVYSTLARLERDGLAVSEVAGDDSGPERRVYELTELGGKELDEWLADDTSLVAPVRDDLHLKIVLAVRIGDPALPALIARHRRQVLAAIASLTRRRDDETDTATRMVLDAALLQVDATSRWLDHCESLLP